MINLSLNKFGGDNTTQFQLGNKINRILPTKFLPLNQVESSIRCFSDIPTKPAKRLTKKERKKLQRLKNLKSREKGFIQALPPIFPLVLNAFVQDYGIDVNTALNNIILSHNAMIKNHGIIEGTKRFNDIRNYAIGLLEGNNPENPGMLSTGRKDRWPSILKDLRPLFYRVRDLKCPDSDRVLRSILYINRLCSGNNAIDVSSIIAVNKIDKEFLTEFETFLSKSVIRCTDELITSPSYKVIRNGPNNKPKWMTADVECYALINSELNQPFKDLCFATGNADLYNYVEARAATHSRVDRIRLRYITSAYDKGNKSRVVAIGDYWTSVLLEPIMYDIQDFVYTHYREVSHAKDHAQAFESVKAHISFGDHSYDMKSWTDNLPATTQYLWMKNRYGPAIADSWWSLVARCEWNVKGSKETVKYGTGQGMGIPCSFDLATATDLELLKFAYSKYYNKAISKEVVSKVGDDLHCHDPDSYIHDMYTKKLGMEIQHTKSKSVRENNTCAEIVSRNLNYGVDVSRISANICRAVRKNLLNLPTLTAHLEERGAVKPLNLPEIFKICKIKDRDIKYYVRTFYILTRFDDWYKPTSGVRLLRSSILKHYREFITSDELLSYIGNLDNNFKSFRYIYYIYCAEKYLHSINDKIGNVFDACSEFDSSDLLKAESDPHNLWSRHEFSIEILTSIIMLSESFKAFNELYAAKDFLEYQDVLETLEGTERKLTFKELGVISAPDPEINRQRVTKLFTLVKSLNIIEGNIPGLDQHLASLDPLRPDIIVSTLVSTNLSIGFDDPIFGTIKRKISLLNSQDSESNK